MNAVLGPPPPPLPPPIQAMNHSPSPVMQPIENDNKNTIDPNENGQNGNESDDLDSDSGLEVIEEPTLRPSDLVRGKHNRTMSTISGKYKINNIELLNN